MPYYLKIVTMDLEIEEQLKQIKMRDLSNTYFYRMARNYTAGSRKKVIIAPPMPKIDQMADIRSCKIIKKRSASEGLASNSLFQSTTIDGEGKHDRWVKERRVFRQEFDDIGNLLKWLENKPIVTEMEVTVADRQCKTQRSPLPGALSFAPPATKGQSSTPSRLRHADVKTVYQLSLQHEPKEQRKCLLFQELQSADGSKRLHRHCTEVLSRDDLHGLLEEDGVEVRPEHPDELVSSLSNKVGDYTVVKDLLADMKTQSQSLMAAVIKNEDQALEGDGSAGIDKHREETQEHQPSNIESSMWTHGAKARLQGRRDAQVALSIPSDCQEWPLSSAEQQELFFIKKNRRSQCKTIKEEDVLVILKAFDRGNHALENHFQPSTLGGDMGRAVDKFRKQNFGEFLDSLEQCYIHAVPVNPARLKRVLLHPGDHVLGQAECRELRQAGTTPLPGCGGRLRNSFGATSCNSPREEKKEEEERREVKVAPLQVHKETPMYPAFRFVRRGPKMMELSTGRAKVGPKTECWFTREQYTLITGNRKLTSSRRANPDAFWPGRENHRLYLPKVGMPPEEVLFECILRSPTPSPGHWPINNRGFSTSGNIDRQKVYSL